MPPKAKKKSGRGKEKKMKRKQEQAEVSAALAKVKAAYEMGDHMEGLPAFRRFNRNGMSPWNEVARLLAKIHRYRLDVSVSFLKVQDVSEDDLKWAFELMKTNMKSLYVKGGWGWKDRDKWDELTHESACFIMARDSATHRPMGFISFRFDLDENTEVVYCYEIQLSPDVKRRGLGKFLMQVLELIGHRASMKKVVLTVFKDNSVSNSFFREKLSYTEDESSPLFCDPLNQEDYTYSILSKTLVKPVKQAGPARPVVPAEGSSEGAQQVTVGITRTGTKLDSSKTSEGHRGGATANI